MLEYKRFGSTIVVRLYKGDDLGASLLSLAEKEQIAAASISGIGASADFTVGIYDTAIHAYTPVHVTSDHEITNMTGNLTTFEGKPYLHMHLTCAGEGGHVTGGHMLACTISLTAEIILQIIDGTIERKKDAVLGINLMAF